MFATGENRILHLVYITVNAHVHAIYFKFWLEAAANEEPTSTFTFGISAPAMFDKFSVASICTYNKCKQVYVLAECSVSGMHRESFDLSQKSEREKLRRFLFRNSSLDGS